MPERKSEVELRAAAEQGDSNAQNMLGDMYREAVGVKQDYSQAMSWYRKGAECGNAYSEYRIGEMYGDGLGVDTNYEQAMIWLHKSMGHGDPDALNAIVYYRDVIAKVFSFSVGHVSCSPAAAAILRENLSEILQCHKRGSWGDIDIETELRNLRALKNGGPLFSVFLLKSGRFAEVQTDAERRSTYVNIKGERGGMFNSG